MHLSNFAFSHLGHELCALGTWYNNSNEKKFDNIILNWKRRVLLCWATRVIERQSFHISMRRRRNILYEINSYSMSFRLWKSVFWDCKKFFILAYNILFTVIFRCLHHSLTCEITIRASCSKSIVLLVKWDRIYRVNVFDATVLVPMAFKSILSFLYFWIWI